MSRGIYVGDISERYIELEYLQSSGTQYIDTGYKPGGDTRVVCEFAEITIGGQGTGASLFGARVDYINQDFTFWSAISEREGFTDCYYSTTKDVQNPKTDKILVDKNKNITTINNDSNYSVSYTYVDFRSAYNLFIFATNKAGSPDIRGESRIYYMKIYDNDVLVRDFVPAVDIKGQYGFFDKLNNQFYTNKGSGTFIVGNNTGNVLYENNTAQKVNQIYIGIDGIARKIKKAYIGMEGAIRLCFNSEPEAKLIYLGSLSSLSASRECSGAASVGNYALFSGSSATMDVYNNSLSRSNTSSGLGVSGIRENAASGNSNYAVFAGGYNSSAYSKLVTAYNQSLTRSLPTALSNTRASLSAVTIEENILFGGGSISSGSYSSLVEVYNGSLTKSTISNLNVARHSLGSTSIGEHAIFCGGRTNEGYSNIVDAYNSKLTKISSVSPLTTGRSESTATFIGNYALIGGGIGADGNLFKALSSIEVYNQSLIKLNLNTLNSAKRMVSSITLSEFAIFAGGANADIKPDGSIDVYGPNLTRKVDENRIEKYGVLTAKVGNYAIFAGGNNSSSASVSTIAFTARES